MLLAWWVLFPLIPRLVLRTSALQTQVTVLLKHSNPPWTLQGVESVPQGFWLMLITMLSSVVSSWLDLLRVVDHSWYTQETGECGKTQQRCSSWRKAVHLAPTTIARSKAHKSCLAHPLSEWHTYTIHVSRLKNPSFNLSPPVIYTDWSGFNKWHE